VNEITLAKTQFAEVLTAAGFRVSEYVPERITPPVVIISSGSPYLVPASIKAEYLMNLEITLVAATASNKQATEKLDEMVADVINALPAYARLANVARFIPAASPATTTLSLAIFAIRLSPLDRCL